MPVLRPCPPASTARIARRHGELAKRHRHMAEESLDLVIHLGDYIYESSWGIRAGWQRFDNALEFDFLDRS
jgi:phosphodiesterase/alkaline phosphatase D-like protein